MSTPGDFQRASSEALLKFNRGDTDCLCQVVSAHRLQVGILVKVIRDHPTHDLVPCLFHPRHQGIVGKDTVSKGGLQVKPPFVLGPSVGRRLG